MKTTLFQAIAAIGLIAAFGATAASATPWQDHHPRRVEVNERASHLDHRIHEAHRDGDLSGWRARHLRHEVRAVHMRERWDARHDNGHITHREDRRLNRTENRISRRVG